MVGAGAPSSSSSSQTTVKDDDGDEHHLVAAASMMRVLDDRDNTARSPWAACAHETDTLASEAAAEAGDNDLNEISSSLFAYDLARQMSVPLTAPIDEPIRCVCAEEAVLPGGDPMPEFDGTTKLFRTGPDAAAGRTVVGDCLIP